MHKELFEQYQRIGNKFYEIIHSSLVHNALVYALSNLSEYEDSGKLWAESLKIHMAEPHLQGYDLSDMNDVFEVADILLRDPYKRMFDNLELIANSFNDEED